MLNLFYMEKHMAKHLNKTLRQEKKYVFKKRDLNRVELKLISLGFRVNHAPNLINNIYFDNSHISAATESVEGDAIRTKFRLRWYNETPKFVLESKVKLSSSGFKDRKQLKGSSLSEAINETEQITKRRAIIQNSYYRRYYVKKNIRITLDDQLKFSLPKSSTFKKSKYCVMEVKYNTEFVYAFDDLNQDLFQLTKFSKYLEGLKCFNII